MGILGRSKLKKEILKLYFAHPERKYYLRELERVIGKPAAYIRRELLNMEKEGLFISEFLGRERYFNLNVHYPLYQEIKKIVAKTIGVEATLGQILQKIKDIDTAFIFGSFAKGNEDSGSDIDLMIIGLPDEDSLLVAVSKLENQIDREINYHVFSRKEFIKMSKSKDSFIQSIFNQPKIFLIGDEKNISRSHRKRTAQRRKD